MYTLDLSKEEGKPVSLCVVVAKHDLLASVLE